MEAIDTAWEAVERGDPTALRRCVAAMTLARDVLAGIVVVADVGAEASTRQRDTARRPPVR